MAWPLSQDYNEAIQSPVTNFADPDLKRGEAVANALGLPMPYSGNFADVYQVRCPDGGRWAVKCFTREALGLRDRYQEISAHLKQAKLPFTVDFSYLEKGMRVAGQWYPVLKMQWVEGLTLNQFVSQYLDKPAMLEALLHLWAKMAKYLRAAEVGHCDLQHGNVLLVPGPDSHSLKLKLIDYDGMWVPALAGTKSGEVGHPNYQHPQRLREGTYSMEVDRFPVLLVAAALRALKAYKGLWAKYDNGDNMLFKEADLREPAQAAVFQELLRLGDPGTVAVTVPLLKSLWARLELVPLLEEVIPDAKGPATPVPTRRSKLGGGPPSGTGLNKAAPQVAPVAVARVVAPPPKADMTFAFDEMAPPPAGSSSSRLKRVKTKPWGKLAGAPMWAWIVGAGAGAAAAVVLLGVVVGFLAMRASGPDKQPAGPPVAHTQPADTGVPGVRQLQTPRASPNPGKAPDTPDPIRPPVQPVAVPEPGSPFIGTWQVDHDGLNEIWTIQANMGDWSVSGTILSMGEELGLFRGADVRYSGGLLTYTQKYSKRPPGYVDGTKITAYRGANNLIFNYISSTGYGKREMVRTKAAPTVAVPQTPPLDATITNSIGMKLVLIPAGKFTMGSPPEELGRNAAEGPQHEVEITKAFYMGTCPVTKGQFAAFAKESGYKTEAEREGNQETWRSPPFAQTDEHPVVDVTWNDATAFYAWLSKKEGKTYELPTEAEWEYACRAGTTTRFWCGDTDVSLKGNANIADASVKVKRPDNTWAVSWDDNYPFTSPVGKFNANPWGLYDMGGNVRQWCADRYGVYLEGHFTDPRGDNKDDRHVSRGGSWWVPPKDSRSACRDKRAPATRSGDFGFRVVLRPDNPPPMVGTPSDTSKPDPRVKNPDANADPKLEDQLDAAVAEARSRIQGEFKDDYAALQNPKDMQALAAKLLGLARGAEAHSLRRYTLFLEARDMAARGEDLAQGFQIAEEAAKEFSQNVLRAKAAALQAGRGSFRSRDAAKAYLDAARPLMEQARADDDYGCIVPVLPAVRQAYAVAQEPELTKTFSAFADQLERLQTEYKAVQPAVQTLKEKLEDPDANTAVGKFYTFLKQDWNRGLPLLAKGGDKALAEAAKKELAPPGNPTDQAALGDGWAGLAKTADGPLRTPMQRKAYTWYARALPNLTDKDQERVEKQVLELTSLFPDMRRAWDHLDCAAAGAAVVGDCYLKIGPNHVLATKQPFSGPLEITLEFRTTKKPPRLALERPKEVLFECEITDKSLTMLRPTDLARGKPENIIFPHEFAFETYKWYSVTCRVTEKNTEAFLAGNSVFLDLHNNDLTKAKAVQVVVGDQPLEIRVFTVKPIKP